MTGPTSPTSERRDRNAGFTLVEVTLAMAIIALVAALALPRVWPGQGATSMRATAYSLAASLRQARNTALAGGSATSVPVDGKARRVGATEIPEDLEIRTAGIDGAVRFDPDGRSSGGAIVLSREGVAYTIRIDPLTAGVQILTGAP